MKARAEELSNGSIRFGHELIELHQDDGGVMAGVRNGTSGREYVVRSRYVVGADGGRLVPGLIGVQYEGLGVITQTATLHVSADFSSYAPDQDVLIRWIFSPRWARSSSWSRWAPSGGGRTRRSGWYTSTIPSTIRAQSDEQVEADVREALGIGALPILIRNSRVVGRPVDRVVVPGRAGVPARRPPTGIRPPAGWG